MTLLRRAIAFTFLAHGAAMLGMALFLLPLVPGGGGAGGDLERMMRIAASPWLYRLGWLGWQITALSDLVLAVALVRHAGRSRIAIAQCVLTVLAVIPDQSAQLLLVTRGVDLARMGAEYRDATDFIAFENAMFPLTSGWAAILYTLGAVGWALTLRSTGVWSRVLARLTAPMLALFAAISVAPVLPAAIRPSPELIGGGNAVAFVILEAWFALAYWLLRQRERSAAPQ